MRIPIIIALVVVLTLPRDVHGLVDDVAANIRTASQAVTNFIARDKAVQVAEVEVKTQRNTVGVVQASVR